MQALYDGAPVGLAFLSPDLRHISINQQLANMNDAPVQKHQGRLVSEIKRMRRRAMSYGYLVPNGYVTVVSTGGYIQILPVNPGVIYVPYYDPVAVFAPPRPGFAIAGAIRFGPAITIGVAVGGWGWWLGSGFVWPSHTILIDRRPWTRVWGNRAIYVHPYVHPWVRPVPPRVEVHHRRR